MILTALALAWAQSDAGEFFPAPVGAKWRYRVETETMNLTKTEQVEAPVKLADDEPALHFRTFQNGKAVGHTYYRVDGDTVYLMANAISRPLDPPRVVFQVGSTKKTWNWRGVEEGLPLTLSGFCESNGERDVLGVKRKTIKIQVDASWGEAPLVWKIRQDAVYAAGIGLVELSEVRSSGKSQVKSVTRLESYSFPEGQAP